MMPDCLSTAWTRVVASKPRLEAMWVEGVATRNEHPSGPKLEALAAEAALGVPALVVACLDCFSPYCC